MIEKINSSCAFDFFLVLVVSLLSITLFKF